MVARTSEALHLVPHLNINLQLFLLTIITLKRNFLNRLFYSWRIEIINPLFFEQTIGVNISIDFSFI